MNNSKLKNLSPLPYEQNKHKFIKVAFDVFEMADSDFESYWTLEKDKDGKEYLVATYVQDDDLTAKSEWEAVLDKQASNVTLYYKDMPIKRFASKEFGFGQGDAYLFRRTLVKRLNEDPVFVKEMIATLPKARRDALSELFPEIQ